jgi:hypothetical protein
MFVPSDLVVPSYAQFENSLDEMSPSPTLENGFHGIFFGTSSLVNLGGNMDR